MLDKLTNQYSLISHLGYEEVFNHLHAQPDAYVSTNENGGITKEDARALFNLVRWIPDLYFGTPQEGCAQRHMLILHIFKALKIDSASVRADKKLSLTIDDTPVVWKNHYVAAARLSDKFASMVIFDPVLFNQPVSLESWQKRLGLKNAHIRITDLKPDNHDIGAGTTAALLREGLLDVLEEYVCHFEPHAVTGGLDTFAYR